MSLFLTPTDYNVYNTLCWGNFRLHAREVGNSDLNCWKRLGHGVIALIELIPGLSQITSLFEWAIYRLSACLAGAPPLRQPINLTPLVVETPPRIPTPPPSPPPPPLPVRNRPPLVVRPRPPSPPPSNPPARTKRVFELPEVGVCVRSEGPQLVPMRASPVSVSNFSYEDSPAVVDLVLPAERALVVPGGSSSSLSSSSSSSSSSSLGVVSTFFGYLGGKVAAVGQAVVGAVQAAGEVHREACRARVALAPVAQSLYPSLCVLSPEKSEGILRFCIPAVRENDYEFPDDREEQLVRVRDSFHSDYAGGQVVQSGPNAQDVVETVGSSYAAMRGLARRGANWVRKTRQEAEGWLARGIAQTNLTEQVANEEAGRLLHAVVTNVANAAENMAANGPDHAKLIAGFLATFTEGSEVGSSLVELALGRCAPQLQTALARCLMEVNRKANEKAVEYTVIRPATNAVAKAALSMTTAGLMEHFQIDPEAIAQARVTQGADYAVAFAEETRKAVVMCHLLRYCSYFKTVQDALIRQDGTLSLDRLLMAHGAGDYDPTVKQAFAGLCEIVGVGPEKLLPVLAGTQLLAGTYTVARSDAFGQVMQSDVFESVMGPLMAWWTAPSGELADRFNRAMEAALTETRTTSAVLLDKERRVMAEALREAGSEAFQVAPRVRAMAAGSAMAQTALNLSVGNMMSALIALSGGVTAAVGGHYSGQIGGNFVGELAERAGLDEGMTLLVIKFILGAGKFAEVMGQDPSLELKGQGDREQ